MGRLLGLDLGKKRVGVAQSDRELILSKPLATLGLDGLPHEIDRIVESEEVVAVVFGVPVDESGEVGKFAKEILELAEKVRTATLIKVPWVGVDEYLSTQEAFEKVPNVGERGMKDAVSAAIILRSFIEAASLRLRRELAAGRFDPVAVGAVPGVLVVWGSK